MREQLLRLGVNALQVLLRLPRIVERLADRLLAVVERLEQRLPRKFREEREQHEEDDDGPDVKTWVGLDQRVIHGDVPSSSGAPEGGIRPAARRVRVRPKADLL